MNASEEVRKSQEIIEDFKRKYPGNGTAPPPPPPEPDKDEVERRNKGELFDEYMEMERKKGTLTDKRWNSLCDILSIKLGYDFSDRKITDDTKHYRDARMRAESEKKVVSIEKPKSHPLQRLYFSAFAPSALEVIVRNKVRPKSCAIYSFLSLNCIYASGVAKVSKHEILEKLNLSGRNAPSYFSELSQTGLIVDKDNHRNRKEVSRFYLPHTHQHAKDIAKEEVGDIFSGGDWILVTPEAVEKLTKATNERKVRGTHWYVYAYLSLNTYRENGVTMKTLSKVRVMKDLNLDVTRQAVYGVFKTLEGLRLIIPEEYKKDVYFLPHILRKFAELAVKNGTN